MLGNLVNRHDLIALLEKARSEGPTRLVGRFARSRSGRVREAWSAESGDDQWWVIEAVRRRWRAKVCGDGDVDFVRYFCDRHLAGRTALDALMVGCGSGYSVPAWIGSGRFGHLRAFDISPSSAARTRERVAAVGVGAIVQVDVADAAALELPAAGYDVVIAEQALHHLTPLDAILGRLARALRSGGFIFVDDFVGPVRHQWTPQQLASANALLALLPASYRRRRNGRLKEAVLRPSIARMVLTDPSEAVESERILPLLARHFELLEVRGYGGTLLHLILSGIAHNFVGTDPGTRSLLDACFAIEDALLAAGVLRDDFVVVVGRAR